MSALQEKSLTETLREEFQDEDYRYAYDEEFSNSRMATQIKVIREQQGLKQVELADLAEMKQSRISALEDVNYNSWSVSTLRRLAKALGVRFFFGFESWGELLPEIEGFGRKGLEKPKFEEDPAFKDAPAEAEEERAEFTAARASEAIRKTRSEPPDAPIYGLASARQQSGPTQPKLGFMYPRPEVVTRVTVETASSFEHFARSGKEPAMAEQRGKSGWLARAAGE